MTISFKQFSSYVDEVDAAPEQLDEIFGKIFGKSQDSEKKAAQLDAAKTSLEKKKAAELARKKELQKKRDDAFAAAKERAESGGKARASTPQSSRGYDRDDYAMHRSLGEAKLPPSFFKMSDATKIETMDLDTAKDYLLGLVDKKASGADPVNVKKAKDAIAGATSIKKLMFVVSGFILASDDKKVIR